MFNARLLRFCHKTVVQRLHICIVTLEDHLQDLKLFVSAPDLEAAALVASNEAIALRQLTIQESGQGVDGDFSDYTDSYARDRSQNGYQTEYKDYTRTGELFRSINPEVIDRQPNSVTVEIKARDRDNQNKLNGAFKKDGNILTNTTEEIDLVTQVFVARINKGLPF